MLHKEIHMTKVFSAIYKYFSYLNSYVFQSPMTLWCLYIYSHAVKNLPAMQEIPGLGRSAGEGNGYPLQYSWASLVAQLVKNPPAMRETWVQYLGGKDPLGKGKATHSSLLAWRIIVHGVAKSRTWLSDFHFHYTLKTHVTYDVFISIHIP